ncbi:type II secretion system major pseudopilin GspG [bacterium]|nr:type II secretion system major pseudopilin GspG [candidate division CSSED10-310 bacterium]
MFLDALKEKKYDRGFTLVEIMVVVVIIGLLAGLVTPRIFNRLDKAKKETARAQMGSLKTTLATYRLDIGRYPDSLECLVRSCGDGWAGPYLDSDEIPLDPWNNPYQYEVMNNGKAFVLTCTADGDEAIQVKG